MVYPFFNYIAIGNSFLLHLRCHMDWELAYSFGERRLDFLIFILLFMFKLTEIILITNMFLISSLFLSDYS